MKHNRKGTWEGDPSHFRPMGRREFLWAGLVGGLGLTLGDYLRLEARADGPAKATKARAQSVIHIFLPGGFPHMDSFDPKPDSPLEYRGELGTVQTKLPDVRFSAHLKQTAEVADKLTVCRSITHTEVDHSRGEHNMFTGYRPSPALVYASMGSVVSHELGPRSELPPYVCVPTQPSAFAGSGYLSTSHGPFTLGMDPGRSRYGGRGGLTVRDLAMSQGVDEERFRRRREIRDLVDDHFAALEKSDALDAMDSFYQRAYAMLSSTKAREAFNLNAEPRKTREEYGQRGSRLLMARRLVEAGVRFVSLSFGSWDTHALQFRGIELQMPSFDQAFAALIRDLDRRGLLDSTLVMVSSEFGRTPKLNSGAGRDHWPRVFSVVLAGGGIKKGHIHGSSDALAAEPKDHPLQVHDFAATIYHLLGVDHAKELLAPGNRPIQIIQNGKVVKELLA